MKPNESDRSRAEALTSRGNCVHTRADQSVFQVLTDEFAAHRIAAEQATRAEIVAKLREREDAAITTAGEIRNLATANVYLHAASQLSEVADLIESNKL